MGLYYLQSRYYDPEMGRFLNADAFVSTGQGELGNNMFAYCRNNPAHRVDRSGAADAECFTEDGKPFESEDIEKDAYGGSPYSSVAINSGTSATPPNGGNISQDRYYSFASESRLNEHYEKHNSEFGNAFDSPQEYLDAANYVIQNGQYIPSQNAYMRFYGMNGRANYAFVGMSSDHNFITTFHLKDVRQIHF